MRFKILSVIILITVSFTASAAWFFTSSGRSEEALVDKVQEFSGLSETDVFEEAQERFEALLRVDINSRPKGVAYQFSKSGVGGRIEVGSIVYLPIARGRAGQSRISLGNVLDRREKIINRGGLSWSSQLGIYLPRYDKGRSVLSKKEAVSGFLIKDEKSGEEYVAFDDGNHRNFASLLTAGASTLPVKIAGDLRGMSLAEAIKKGQESGFFYLNSMGGKVKSIYLPRPYEMENDKIRYIVSLLTAKFEIKRNFFQVVSVVPKAANGPKLFVKVKVNRASKLATVPYTEFKVADQIYNCLERFTNSQNIRKQNLASRWRHVLDLKPSKLNLPKIAQVVSEILNHQVSEGSFVPEELNIHYLGGTQYLGLPFNEYEEWYKTIFSEVKESIKDLGKSKSIVDLNMTRAWKKIVKKHLTRKNWADISEALQEIARYEPVGVNVKDTDFLKEWIRVEILSSPMEAFLSYQMFSSWYDGARSGLSQAVTLLKSSDEVESKVVRRWGRAFDLSISEENWATILQSILEMNNRQILDEEKLAAKGVNISFANSPFNRNHLRDQVDERFEWIIRSLVGNSYSPWLPSLLLSGSMLSRISSPSARICEAMLTPREAL